MQSVTLTLDEATYSSISELCERFISSSNAQCVLLVGRDGILLHASGATTNVDVDSLSALAAGTFASTQEIAGLIGEDDFEVILQQSHRHHLQLIRVGQTALLVVVFDNRATTGMVRLHGQRLARRLAQSFAEIDAAPQGDSAYTLEDELGGSTQTKEAQLRTHLRLRTISLVLALLAAAIAAFGSFLRH